MPKTTRRNFLQWLGAGAAAWHAQGAEAPQRPNILWLSAEDICPLLGCYGDPFACTPNLDRLAQESIRYDRAYSNAPVCSPSRSGIITGVFPSRLGTHQHRSKAVLPPEIRCFTEYLREAGYYCSNNQKKDYNFVESPGAWDDSSAKAHWRNRAPGQPFFSVFNHEVCHESLLHKTEADFDAIRRRWGVQRHDPAKVRIPVYHPDTPEFREDWARYYDAITALDAQIAERLKELDTDGLAENTLVMFWGDNGTGIVRGKRWLYESGTRVPLIVRVPDRYRDRAPGGPGTVETRLTGLMDLGPTVLRLAGLPVPDYMDGKPFLGPEKPAERKYVCFTRDRMDDVQDCIRSLRGSRFRHIRNFYPHLPYDQYNEYLFKERSAQAWHKLTGALMGDAALFLRPEKPMEELFDTEADPEEVHDLAGDPNYRPVLVEMRQALNSWILETRDLGLLDESELYRRTQGAPAMKLGADPKAYDLPRILETANLPLDGAAAAPELRARLSDADSAVRYWAATGLAVLKDASDETGSALRKALNDACPGVRVAAAHALCRVGDYDAALPAFKAAVQDGDRYVRMHALNVLALLGKYAAPLLDSVQALTADKDEYVQRAAKGARIRMGEALTAEGI